MKQISVTEAMKLVRSNGKAAISIYLGTDLPAPGGITTIGHNLQKLYRTVEDFISRTYDGRAKDQLLTPLKRSLASLHLSRQSGGVAIYHSEDFTGLVQIPTPTRDLAVAAASYHLKPVMRCLQLRRKFYFLAMRKKYAEFFLVTPDGPRLLESVVMFAGHRKSGDDFASERVLQRSEPKRNDQQEIDLSITRLSHRIESHLSGETIPLLIAGSDQLQKGFRDLCNYQHLLAGTFKSKLDTLDQNSLIGLASHFMEQHFSQGDELAVINFRKAKSFGHASTHLKTISLAAVNGQIKSLLVAEDRHLWGYLDRFSGRLQLIKQKTEARSDDILDDLAELTLLKGGAVTVLPSLQMPDGAPIAAILSCDNSSEAIPTHQIQRPYSRLRGKQPFLQIKAQGVLGRLT